MIRRLLTLSIAVAAVCFTGATFAYDATMTTMDNSGELLHSFLA